jgi:hypothetical protein
MRKKTHGKSAGRDFDDLRRYFFGWGFVHKGIKSRQGPAGQGQDGQETCFSIHG